MAPRKKLLYCNVVLKEHFSFILCSGAVYRCMQPVEDPSLANEGEGSKWAAVSDRLLVPFLDQLLYHIARYRY